MARKIDFSKHELPVKLAAHAIGLDHKRPYMRAGKTYYRPYRNYYTTLPTVVRDYSAWMGLAAKGYATRQIIPGGGHCFKLTRAGLDWLGIVLGVIIHNEER